eukprot:TRINITY_DN6128_c0_g1_i1.p1 TRINITY_DN6128_c0_g1~~TRINITY_DN6128_c0_g1_i1.p1  ORF type:complete len:937 (+),score=145.58 TRINITY_DN6128_c0_g1_i1:23-2812(+)
MEPVTQEQLDELKEYIGSQNRKIQETLAFILARLQEKELKDVSTLRDSPRKDTRTKLHRASSSKQKPKGVSVRPSSFGPPSREKNSSDSESEEDDKGKNTEKKTEETDNELVSDKRRRGLPPSPDKEGKEKSPEEKQREGELKCSKHVSRPKSHSTNTTGSLPAKLQTGQRSLHDSNGDNQIFYLELEGKGSCGTLSEMDDVPRGQANSAKLLPHISADGVKYSLATSSTSDEIFEQRQRRQSNESDQAVKRPSASSIQRYHSSPSQKVPDNDHVMPAPSNMLTLTSPSQSPSTTPRKKSLTPESTSPLRSPRSVTVNSTAFTISNPGTPTSLTQQPHANLGSPGLYPNLKSATSPNLNLPKLQLPDAIEGQEREQPADKQVTLTVTEAELLRFVQFNKGVLERLEAKLDEGQFESPDFWRHRALSAEASLKTFANRTGVFLNQITGETVVTVQPTPRPLSIPGSSTSLARPTPISPISAAASPRRVSVIHARDNNRKSLVNVQFTQNDVEYVQHKLLTDFTEMTERARSNSLNEPAYIKVPIMTQGPSTPREGRAPLSRRKSSFILGNMAHISSDELLPIFTPLSSVGLTLEPESPRFNPFYNLLRIPDIYKDKFFASRHLNFLSYDKDRDRFSVISVEETTHGLDFHACVENGPNGFKKFTLPQVITGKRKPKDEKVILGLLQGLGQFQGCILQYIKEEAAIHDILRIEREQRQKIRDFKIAVMYSKCGQSDPSEMFENKFHNISADYSDWMQIMGVPTVKAKKLSDLSVQWLDKEVTWLSSVLLNHDDQRNYIGNTPVIVFFKDRGEVLDTSAEQIKKLGNLALVFFVVQPVDTRKYRIACFFREGLSVTSPPIPKNYVFDEASIKDFLLTKIHNAHLMLRHKPPLDVMYSRPRHQAIMNIVRKYGTKEFFKNCTKSESLRHALTF